MRKRARQHKRRGPLISSLYFRATRTIPTPQALKPNHVILRFQAHAERFLENFGLLLSRLEPSAEGGLPGDAAELERALSVESAWATDPLWNEIQSQAEGGPKRVWSMRYEAINRSSGRRLVRWGRRTRLGRRSAIVLAILSVVCGIATYAILTGATFVRPEQEVFRALLWFDLVLLLMLGAVVARRLVVIWGERRRGSAGSRLHTRW